MTVDLNVITLYEKLKQIHDSPRLASKVVLANSRAYDYIVQMIYLNINDERFSFVTKKAAEILLEDSKIKDTVFADNVKDRDIFHEIKNAYQEAK